ncbi:DNA ligase [Helicobacter pametensis]|uniref:DNA ligase n=1 Tax=Helicobacter pametensis TaxID=95149 RepID=UPI0004BCD60F|nr:DNA ligase [Helicobacter pametensis]
MLKIFFCLYFVFGFLAGRELLLLAPCDEALIAQNPHQYLWSEKLDGVRAYWDGKALYTRSGKKLNPPAFFTQNFPPFAIDGELWSKRGDFENIVSIIKNKNRSMEWKNLRFHIFEVPHQQGDLIQRLSVLQDYLANHYAPFISIIPHSPLISPLASILKQIIQENGEGIVIRDKSAPYYTGRNKQAMKCKTYQDRECKITRFIQGKGKFEGMVGSFLCQDGEKIIKIGSGMDENFRKNPPSIGTIITYKFFGHTNKGNPRFPTFLRIRSDSDFSTHFSNKGKNENQTND